MKSLSSNLKTITAGDSISILVEARDEHSGIRSVEVEASNVRDLPSAPHFEVITTQPWPAGEESLEVNLQIPEWATDSKWKITTVNLINNAGRIVNYYMTKDFPAVEFFVKAKEGIDQAPPELVSVTIAD